jgi:hypothetical protein
MPAFAKVGGIAECIAVGGRYRATAAGLIFVLALASGAAIGTGAIVERLTTSDTTGPALVGEANQTRLALSACYVGDRWCAASQTESGTSLRHVVDRWFDESLPEPAP